MYMQYFLGLEEYTYNDVFDRSLFTTLRYRLGVDKFDAMTRQIILTSEGKHEAARKDLDDNQQSKQEQGKSSPCENKSNEKPRTYRRLARKQYLNVAKKKNKSKSELRKAIGQQLRYLRRNLKSINGLLDQRPEMSFPLETRDQRIFWVIQQ